MGVSAALPTCLHMCLFSFPSSESSKSLVPPERSSSPVHKIPGNPIDLLPSSCHRRYTDWTMNRRSFIYRASGITICLPALVSANRPLLTWTGSDCSFTPFSIRSKEDLGKTIQEVAKIGYKQVEPFGFPLQSHRFDYPIQRPDMQVNSSHFDWNSLWLQAKRAFNRSRRFSKPHVNTN